MPLTPEDRELWRRYMEDPSAGLRIVATKRPSSWRQPTTLDLHGLVLQDAWMITKGFLAYHHEVGTKWVTVICGKGGGIARELVSWCMNTGLVSDCQPLIDSKGEHGSYRILMRKKK